MARLDLEVRIDASFSSSTCSLGALFFRSVLVEVVIWTALYYAVFAFYHLVLVGENKRAFYQLAKHVRERLDWISITFILAFFVPQVIDRWKKAFENIGFVENICHQLNFHIRGRDDEARLSRRSIARWLCLAQVLILRDLSIPVRKRFPTLAAVQQAGYLEPGELPLLVEAGDDGYQRYWVPFHWANTVITRLVAAGRIKQDGPQSLLLAISKFREQMLKLCCYDWVPIPLAYTQVVFVAVRTYFLLCLLARQEYTHLDVGDFKLANGEEATRRGFGYYFPFMTIVQLVVYLGWLKVAEALLNPFGEDDDDLECNFVIDHDISVAMAVVDKYHDCVPELALDRFAQDDRPLYSEEAADEPQYPPVGSAAAWDADSTGKVNDAASEIKMVPRSPRADKNNDNSAVSLKRRVPGQIHPVV